MGESYDDGKKATDDARLLVYALFILFCLLRSIWRCLTNWHAHQREQRAIARGARSVTDAREQQAAHEAAHDRVRERRVLLRQERLGRPGSPTGQAAQERRGRSRGRLGRRQPGSTTERLLAHPTAPTAAEAEAVDVPAPAALILHDINTDDEWFARRGNCYGIYELESERLNGKPVFRNVSTWTTSMKLLAFDGQDWMVLDGAGQAQWQGSMRLDGATMPGHNESPWQVSGEGGWSVRSSISCREVAAAELARLNRSDDEAGWKAMKVDSSDASNGNLMMAIGIYGLFKPADKVRSRSSLQCQCHVTMSIPDLFGRELRQVNGRPAWQATVSNLRGPSEALATVAQGLGPMWMSFYDGDWYLATTPGKPGRIKLPGFDRPDISRSTWWYDARRLRVNVRAATANEQTQSHSISEAVVSAQPAPTVGRLVDSGASPVVVHAVPLATRPQAAQLDASQEVASAPPRDAVNFCGNCGAGVASGKRFCTGCGAPLGSE
jgi:hypothetical protein